MGYHLAIKIYNGLSKEKIIEAYSLVMQKRKKLCFMWGKLVKVLKEKLGVEIKLDL